MGLRNALLIMIPVNVLTAASAVGQNYGDHRTCGVGAGGKPTGNPGVVTSTHTISRVEFRGKGLR